ncbi:hypothetical protein [uncultured Serinicoccus sp.]|uniref:hypothetical protein n=1 Tax=uncultured Serinicoccus sp. TaxID=735514 RepID=UPI002629F005|nr:hypothetical protein [uncultured Serinicoccus sp.]
MNTRWAIAAGAGAGPMLAGCDSAEPEPAVAPPTVTATVTATEEVEVTRDVEVTETVTEMATVEADPEELADEVSGEFSEEITTLALKMAWSDMESADQTSLCEFYVLAPEAVADMFVAEAGENFDSGQIMEFFDEEC